MVQINPLNSNGAAAKRTDIATVENGSVASRAYEVGELVYVGDSLYKVTTAISEGSTFVVGTNIQSTNVGNELVDVEDRLDYSGTECVVGKYTDGKTIYGKIITLNNPNVSWGAIDLAPYLPAGGVDRIFKGTYMRGVRSNNVKVCNDYRLSDSDMLDTLIAQKTNSLDNCLFIRSSSSFVTFEIEIRYTKA